MQVFLADAIYLHREEAVSYTHLDVYKRQEEQCEEGLVAEIRTGTPLYRRC